MSNTLTPTGFTAAPSVPQANAPGQIVGLVLQNTAGTALAAQPTTFGQVFKQGAVKPGSSLTATIDGQTYAVQMDAKTFNPDGSVAMAVLTINAPELPPNSSTGVMLATGTGTNASAVDLASALKTYSLTTTLDITANAGGPTGTQTINVAQAVESAIAAGKATYWLQGPLATEAIVSIPVSGSLRIEADVTAYANGTVSATLQFNNDAAMQANGGTITYSATITQNGQVVSQQLSLTQYQYQDWSTTVGTTPSSTGLNIQHDIPYLEATGAVPNYDTQYGVSTSIISTGYNSEATQIAAAGWNAPLGTDGITQYMPNVGGRGDIGPTTESNATWLITQNATAARYALGQAQEAGSVPWHFYDPTGAGAFLSTNTPGDANIWTDGRGGPSSGTTGLTQQVNGQNSGWTPDQAHMPDLSYVAYLQTGDVQYLEQLNAQASYAEISQWSPTRQINAPNGQTYSDIIVNGEQVRGAAWSLRAVQEAAYANPAGSTDKAAFTQITNDNYAYLVSMIPTWTQNEGQAYGYLVGVYGNIGAMAPWQQDYLASTIVQGAEMGNQNALTFLKWESNYLVGRFFADAQGFNPRDAIAYNLYYYNAAEASGQGPANSGAYYKSWAQIEQATEAAGQSNVTSGGATGWGHSGGDYGALALQTLSGIITVSVANPTVMGAYQYQAMQAFGWLLASGAPYINPNSTASTTTQFLIDPRLANGQLLSFGNVTISTDTKATLLQPVDPTQNALLYAGSGADTLVGGKGINLLFGGSGADTIIGGPNGNDIFAGSGDETILAGGGATFIQASTTALLTPGTGKDLFVLDAASSGAVTIAGFNPALDHLDLVDAAGSPVSAGNLTTLLAGAQTVTGGVVLTISPNETLTIETGGADSVNASWFQQSSQTVPTGDPTSTSGGSTSTVGGSASTAGGSTSTAGGATSTVGGSTSTTGSTTSIVGSGASVSGDATVTATAQRTNIVAGAASATINAGSSGFDSITGGAGSISVNGGGAIFLFQAGAGNALVNQRNTAANGEIVTGSGNMTINAGSGFDYIDVTDTNNASTLVVNGFSFARDPINYMNFPTNDYLKSASFTAAGGTITLVDGQTIDLNYAAASAGGSAAGPTAAGASQSAAQHSQIVSLNQSGQHFVGGAVPVILSDQGGSNTITGGTGGMSVTDSAGHDLITTAANSSNALNLAGSDTVMSSGRDAITMTGGGVVNAGAGALAFIGGAQASTVFGGSGAITATGGYGGIDVHGGSGSIMLVEATGVDTVSAGSGNITLNGGTGTLDFTGGSGGAVINQGAENALIAAGGGNITVNAGSAFDYFSFSGSKPGGSVTINNFNSGRDPFNYSNVGIQSSSFGNATDRLTLTDGTTITMNLAPH